MTIWPTPTATELAAIVAAITHHRRTGRPGASAPAEPAWRRAAATGRLNDEGARQRRRGWRWSLQRWA